MMNNTLTSNNFKQSHKRIQSAQVPRNIVPSKLYDQTRFNYIIKQAEELKGFEFNDNNPALAAYGQEGEEYGNSQYQSPDKFNQGQTIQRPFTAASRIVGVYDYTARHFPSICENKLNYSNRSKMHMKQKFGQRQKTKSLIEQSNEWQKQNQHKFIVKQEQQEDIKEEDEDIQNNNQQESEFVQHIGFKLWKQVETDHEQFYRYNSKYNGQLVEVNFYPLKMQITENQFSYMTIKDLAKLIRYPKDTLKDFFKEFLVQDEKTGQVLFEVDAFAEYYENANDEDEEGEYDEFIEEFNVTFPYISVYVENLSENFIINLKKSQILEIIDSGFEKLKDFADSQFIKNIYQQQNQVENSYEDDYNNNLKQNQMQNGDNNQVYNEEIKEEQKDNYSENQDESQQSFNELDQIQVHIVEDEYKKPQNDQIFKYNFELDEEFYALELQPPQIKLITQDGKNKQLITGLTFKQMLIYIEICVTQDPFQFLAEIVTVNNQETRKGQIVQKVQINFPDNYELEDNIHLVERAVQNGILQKEEGVVEIDSAQYHMIVEPPKIVLTNRNDLKKSIKYLTTEQLSDIVKYNLQFKIRVDKI